MPELALVRAALALPPLGLRSDFDLNPGFAHPSPLREAAVLCPLVPRSEGLHVVLIRRADHLSKHAGQVAFPGGKVDATDPSPLAAALRETTEEIGLTPPQVQCLGGLDPYITSTGFRVQPFVGLIDPDFAPVPDPAEVAEVFEVPLAFLMDPANHRKGSREWRGATRYFWEMPFGPHYIWGATAGMLRGFADRIAAARQQAGRGEDHAA